MLYNTLIDIVGNISSSLNLSSP